MYGDDRLIGKDSNAYLKHILDAIGRIGKYTKGMDENSFYSSDLVQAAVIREIQIIGEAAKMIDDDLKKKHAEIPWKSIVDMRDKLIHHYFGVDVKAVWKTVKEDIPALSDMLEHVLL